jgi:uridine kinase
VDDRTVPFPIAAHAIRLAAASLAPAPLGPARRAVIAITGPVGAGKSTLAAQLSPCILSTDDYLPDYDAVAYHQRDLPEAADLPALARDLASLRDGHRTLVPVWSFQTHKREGTRPVEPADLIVCEGLHALHDSLACAVDLRVYVDAPRDLRWKRWEILESTGQRGWGVEVAKTFFDQVAEPTFERLSARHRESAHIIVVNDA